MLMTAVAVTVIVVLHTVLMIERCRLLRSSTAAMLVLVVARRRRRRRRRCRQSAVAPELFALEWHTHASTQERKYKLPARLRVCVCAVSECAVFVLCYTNYTRGTNVTHTHITYKLAQCRAMQTTSGRYDDGGCEFVMFDYC